MHLHRLIQDRRRKKRRRQAALKRKTLRHQQNWMGKLRLVSAAQLLATFRWQVRERRRELTWLWSRLMPMEAFWARNWYM